MEVLAHSGPPHPGEVAPSHLQGRVLSLSLETCWDCLIVWIPDASTPGPLLTLDVDSWTANPLSRVGLSVRLLLGSHRVLRSGSAVPCPSHCRTEQQPAQHRTLTKLTEAVPTMSLAEPAMKALRRALA